MSRPGFAVLVALAGCGSPDDSGELVFDVDAAVAADAPAGGQLCAPGGGETSMSTRLPFVTTGTTPAGSLDDVSMITISFMGGNCPGTYHLALYRASADSLPVVRFDVPIPPNATEPLTGTITASACTTSGGTDEVSFEIAHLDVPPTNPQQPVSLRIAGHMTINSGPWNVDFTVDAETPNAICLLF